MSLELDSSKFLMKHIIGGLRATLRDHPDCGLKPLFIGSAAKRVLGSVMGECVSQYRQKLNSDLTTDLVHQEILKENAYLKVKIESIAKSNRYLLRKLKENNVEI